LAEHREDADADFVFRSWLEAGGERELVWDAALAWLARHRLEESAVYVTKFIARQRDLPATAIGDVLAWCRTFPGSEDAVWRLTQLGQNLFVEGLEEDVLLTAEVVFDHLLTPSSDIKIVTRGQVTALLSYLVESYGMQFGAIRERVDLLLIRWLRHPMSFGNSPRPHPAVQRVTFLKRLSALMATGALELGNDREALQRFLRWVNAWDLAWKERATPVLEELRSNYPAPELWDIVRYYGS